MRISNKEALEIIINNRIQINGLTPFAQQAIQPEDVIELDGRIIKEAEKFIYLAYYKPRGIECTLNTEIPNNLADALHLPAKVFPVGRLDKESEGLLLLTNDGKLYNKISHEKEYKEKEYIVTVNKALTNEAISMMSSGISILGKMTRPAKVNLIDDFTFRIILTQGLNRQIRRMCYKTGYEVTSLKRIRVVNIHLEALKPGEWRTVNMSFDF